MNINSENIVDVFLRKITESLPVEERDAYQIWKKGQEYKASHAAEYRRDAVIERKKSKKAADCAYWIDKFFDFGDVDSVSSKDNHVDLNYSDGHKEAIIYILDKGEIFFYSSFFELLDLYKVPNKKLEDGKAVMIWLNGTRETVGPLYGKFKKAGLRPIRDEYNYFQVTFDGDEFIEAIKKGLRITDFTKAIK
jgi:hypothetical protein